MAVKDYYAMLQVPPGASQVQIKKAFRKLAQRYHPDKQPDNPEAAAWYQELQTAYQTLTTPHLLRPYLEQRWLYKASGRRFAKAKAADVSEIIEAVAALSAQSLLLNHNQLDYSAWYTTIMQSLNDETIEHLKKYATATELTTVSNHTISSAECLPLPLQEKIIDRLSLLFKSDDTEQNMLRKKMTEWKRRARWQHQEVWIMAGAALAICVLLYWLVVAG